ncbi:hypothetical protein X798_01698 [Onchocerca flexuosa]|uniref:Uncharacterized protein n=1 Tax=Onchocerca flexuosa TaxID=387005 RepID=A0A238C1A3_9BILA|nr:hypothetical protein X798_01698 [Onchocerca flexuosa]
MTASTFWMLMFDHSIIMRDVWSIHPEKITKLLITCENDYIICIMNFMIRNVWPKMKKRKTYQLYLLTRIALSIYKMN